MTIAITPETCVGELLEAYPEIDGTLSEYVPALGKLKNPVLRKTLEKTTTLDQATRLGGMSVRDLVMKLREKTGQTEANDPAVAADLAPAIVERIDADAMLATGVHPVGRVREACSRLAPGEAVEMSVGFRPAPLLDTMHRAGFAVTCQESPAGGFLVRFIKP